MVFTNGIAVNYSLPLINLYADWYFHSGQVFSLPTSRYLNAAGDIVLDFSLRNNQRMSNYYSLSVGAEYSYNSRYVKYIFSAGISNISNHFNPVYSYIYRQKDVYKVSQISGLPIYPYVKIKASL